MSPTRLAFAVILLASNAAAPAAEKLSELRGVFRASFNHDGSRVVVRDREGAVTIWELPSGTPVIGELDPKTETDGFLMSADGKQVGISFKDGRCRVFHPMNARGIAPVLDSRLNGAFEMPVLVSPDGKTLLLFGDNEAVGFEIASGNKVATIPLGEAVSEEATGSAPFASGG